MRISTRLTLTAMVVVAIMGTGYSQNDSEQHPRLPGGQIAEVLKLNPVGYWPADEGKGTTLHDRSGHHHHGTIRAVPWRDGFLIFDNDYYQWIEVPYTEELGSNTFSMGGWLYPTYDKKANPIIDTTIRGRDIGAILIGQPFIWAKNYDGDSIAADQKKFIWRHGGGALLRYGIPKTEKKMYLEVASDKQDDVLGTVESKTVIVPQKWQHLFYTYHGACGRGSVYLNGALVKSADDIPFEQIKTPFVIGGGRWATGNTGGTTSLDGTLRHIAFFDRPLNEEEVARLCDLTRPTLAPQLTLYSERQAKPRETETETVVYSRQELIERVKDRGLDDFARGKAALQLASLGPKAKSAVPLLVAELQTMIDADGSHLPKVEEFFRNALIRALLDSDCQDPRVKKLLADALVKPFFEKIDATQAHYESIRPFIQSGEWFGALQAYKMQMKSLPPLNVVGWGQLNDPAKIDTLLSKNLPLRREYFQGYLSKGMPNADAATYLPYNVVDYTRDGYTYACLIERVPFDEVQRQFDKHLKTLTDQHPDEQGERTGKYASTWTRKWSRIRVVQLSPDKTRTLAYLEGPWFIFDAEDRKMDGWSVVVDNKGYIHLAGGQHNSPNPDNYLPGIWSQLGLAEGDHAFNFYWVSKRPRDISEFEFVGDRKNPRSISGSMNYTEFVRSRDGQIFFYGRGTLWTWALQRYDSDERRWTNIKGQAQSLLNDAEKGNPEWYANLGSTVPFYSGPSDGFVVAWQPAGYNFNRAARHVGAIVVRGMAFDPSNRMHVNLPILGVGQNGLLTHAPVYAYSDDMGETFYTADGKKLTLPLTVNPIPGHCADRTVEPAKSHFRLWASLLNTFGVLDEYEVKALNL